MNTTSSWWQTIAWGFFAGTGLHVGWGLIGLIAELAARAANR